MLRMRVIFFLDRVVAVRVVFWLIIFALSFFAYYGAVGSRLGVLYFDAVVVFLESLKFENISRQSTHVVSSALTSTGFVEKPSSSP